MKLLSLIFAAMFAFSTVNVFAGDVAPAADKKVDSAAKKKPPKKGSAQEKEKARGDTKSGASK